MNTLDKPITQIIDEYAEARRTHIKSQDRGTKLYYPFPLAKDDPRKVYIVYVHEYDQHYLAYKLASGKIPVQLEREYKKSRSCDFCVSGIGCLRVCTTSDGKQWYKRLAQRIIEWCLGNGARAAREELGDVINWGAPNTQPHWFCGRSYGTALKPGCDTDLVLQTLDRHLQESLKPFIEAPIISAVVAGHEIPPFDCK